MPKFMKGIWSSRKFWALVAAIGGAVAGALSGEIAWNQAINLIVAAIMVYIGATGVQKIGSK